MKCRDCDEQISEGRKCGLCKICYARDYRKRNKDKIRPVTRAKYLRRKEYFKKQTRKWIKDNRERYNEVTRKLYKKNSKEWNIREKTRYHYSGLKKESSCEICGSENKLEFHHERPYNIHKFAILCFRCHRKLHGQLFTKKQIEKFIELVDKNRNVRETKHKRKVDKK